MWKTVLTGRFEIQQGIIDYLDSTTVFDLKAPPKDLIIMGGFIALEFAHFFSSIGTRISIIGRNIRLLPHTEPEISLLIQEKMSKRMDSYTDTKPLALKKLPAVSKYMP